MLGVWMDPVTAQVMMTLLERFMTILFLPIIAAIRHYGVFPAGTNQRARVLPGANALPGALPARNCRMAAQRTILDETGP